MNGKERWPLRGEIWFVQFPTDPPEKGLRPVVIVSIDNRNTHPRANTVLVAPLTTSQLQKVPTRVYLSPGETGLEVSCVKGEDVTVVRKSSLREPRTRLRTLSHSRICQIADAVRFAMGCPPR